MLNKKILGNGLNCSSKVAMALAVVLFVAGCATSPKVPVVQVGDNALSSQQLREEIARLDEADRNIDSKKGVTGTNVAAALFFWPGLIYTHMDASEATRLVEQRRNHLTNLYNKKIESEGKRGRG